MAVNTRSPSRTAASSLRMLVSATSRARRWTSSRWSSVCRSVLNASDSVENFSYAQHHIPLIQMIYTRKLHCYRYRQTCWFHVIYDCVFFATVMFEWAAFSATLCAFFLCILHVECTVVSAALAFLTQRTQCFTKFLFVPVFYALVFLKIDLSTTFFLIRCVCMLRSGDSEAFAYVI